MNGCRTVSTRSLIAFTALSIIDNAMSKSAPDSRARPDAGSTACAAEISRKRGPLAVCALSKVVRMCEAATHESGSSSGGAGSRKVDGSDKENSRLHVRGCYYVAQVTTRIPSRHVLDSALGECLRKVKNLEDSREMGEVVLSRPRVLAVVDGNLSRALLSAARSGLCDGRRAVPRCIYFTRLEALIRMGHKHVMADALGTLPFVPTTYSSMRRPPGRRLPGLWFLKPALEAEGRGIQVLKDPVNVSLPTRPAYVLQKGVEPPLLLRGHKFDVRIWVTVRGDGYYVVHDDGRLRVSALPYVADTAADPGTHITNVAFQPPGDWRSSWPTRLSETPWYESFMKQVRTAVHKVLRTAFLRATRDGGTGYCDATGLGADIYHVTGWDFIADSAGKVWLLEMNISPAAHDADGAIELYTEWARQAARFALLGPDAVGALRCWNDAR